MTILKIPDLKYVSNVEFRNLKIRFNGESGLFSIAKYTMTIVPDEVIARYVRQTEWSRNFPENHSVYGLITDQTRIYRRYNIYRCSEMFKAFYSVCSGVLRKYLISAVSTNY